MNKDLLSVLIHRYKSGIATEEEKMTLEAFWEQARADTSILDALTPAQRTDLREFIFSKIQIRITPSIPLQRTRSLSPWLYGVAASIVLMVLSTIAMRLYNERMLEVRTGFGEQIAITLPDNSTVTLNGNSSLRYRRSWDDADRREVWINGEGFFSVTHTKDHNKFVVHASDQLNVEVLGTKFNVRSRNLNSEVMLTEGKIKLNMQDSEADALYLKPGELAVMTDKKLSKHVVSDKKYTSWLTNRMIFDHTTLKEVAKKLNDTYGLDVVFEEQSLQDRELSGEIASADVNDILTGIAQIFNLKVERSGNVVTISVNGD